MITRTLGAVADMCGGELSPGSSPNASIEGVVTDSRKITPGCLFVPLSGDHFDGHDYAAGALESGAAATLWSAGKGPAPARNAVVVGDTLAALQALAAAYLSEAAPRVVAVTGSNGKTTTKDMITALLETTFKVHKTQGNFNNHIGLPLTILSMPEDTDIAVLEMGMSARGEIALLSSIGRPDTAVITNIGESHLLQLGSRKEIARAKLEIVEGLRSGGLLICNGDEPLIAEVMQEPGFKAPEGMKIFRFGLEAGNDDYPTGIMNHPGGTTFTTSRHDGQVFTLPLPGRHNVVNCLAAMAVAEHYGVTGEKMAEGLAGLKLTGMRIELIQTKAGLTLLNDAYNASPTSMKAAIDVLQSMKGAGSKIAVLGDMLELGPDETAFHAEVGSYLDASKVDRVFTYGPLSIHLADAARASFGPDRVHAYADKTELTAALLNTVGAKDIVLFKASRGMKLEETLQALRVRFD